MDNSDSSTAMVDLHPKLATFRAEVVAGLEASPKSLPCKYFYDERGSKLFDQICELDEYYLTRTEDEIITRYAREMAEQIGRGVMLIEYGSGSSTKTRTLLDHLDDPVAYVPVDISRKHLRRTAAKLSRAYPSLEVLPVCADFTTNFRLPTSVRTPTHKAIFFPGSTIGNFEPAAARAILQQIAELSGIEGGLLIGIDLQKDIPIIEAAYNDSHGITAAFNLNLLKRINRDLDTNFDVSAFRHRAVYDRSYGRIELSLVSREHQTIVIGDRLFEVEKDEPIVTEYSHKYTVKDFASMAADVGMTLRRSWLDDDRKFAVLHFVLLNEPPLLG